MNSLTIKLYLYLSKIIHLHNPLLLLTEEEDIPIQFCSGISFPIICTQYSVSDRDEIAHHILHANDNSGTTIKKHATVNHNPIFVSGGDHKGLIMKLRDHPLLFSFGHIWVMPFEYVSIVPLRLDNNIIFYEYVIEGAFDLYESYAIKGETSRTTRLLQWPNETKSLKILTGALEGRSNLHGAILKHPQIRNRQDFLNRRWEDILVALQSKLNFTLQKINNKDKRWGSKHKNGTWNGVIGLLLADEIDLVDGLMQNAMRQEVIGFCWPPYENRITLMRQKNVDRKVNVFAYVVFPTTAWIVCLGTLVVLALCFSLSNKESLVQGFILVMRLFLQMGYEISLKGIASRSLLMTTALCLNIIFIHYTTDLTATMTADSPDVNIRSFEDAERLGYDVAIITGSGTMPFNLLKSAPKGSAMHRYYKDAKIKIIENNGELLKLIKSDPKTLAFHYSTRFHKEVIKMDIIEATTFPQSIALKKDSEFFPLFNHYLIKMQEVGLTGRALIKHSQEPDTEFGMSEPLVLGFDNLFFPFGWLALGVAFAVTILVAEVIMRWFKT